MNSINANPTTAAADSSPEMTPSVHLDDLKKFFANPARTWLSHCYQISLPKLQSELPEAEPYQLDHLTRWKLGDYLLKHRLEHPNDDPPSLEEMAALGLLPAGVDGTEVTTLLGERGQKLERLAGDVKASLPAQHQTWPLTLELGQGQLLIADLPLALGQDGNPAGQLVGWRFGDYRPKDQLDLWLEHLFVCALLADLPDNQKHSRFLCTKRIKPYSYLPLPADEACAELRALLQLYRRGQTSLLPFLPDTSFEYAKAVNKGKAQSATRVWNDHSGGDIARDPAWRLLLGPLQSPLLPADFFGPSDGTLESPMPAGFDELATQVFGPMLANADSAGKAK